MENYKECTREEVENELDRDFRPTMGIVSLMAAIMFASSGGKLGHSAIVAEAFKLMDETKRQFEARIQQRIANENRRRKGY
jgi:hypothetical protein